MTTPHSTLDLDTMGELLERDAGARDALAAKVLEWFLEGADSCPDLATASPNREAKALPEPAATSMGQAIGVLAELLDEFDREPDAKASRQTRAQQAKQALARPLPDDGTIYEIAIERLPRGKRVRLPETERHLAAFELARRGHSDPLIATRVGISDRTVPAVAASGRDTRWWGTLKAVRSA